ELRLGEKSAGQLEDLAGPAQLLDLALQFLDALSLAGRDATTNSCVDLCAPDPAQQRLRHAAALGRNRFNCGPQRWVFPTVLLHHAHGALTDLLDLSWLHYLKS